MHTRGLQAFLRLEPSFTWRAWAAAGSDPYTHTVTRSTHSSNRGAIPSVYTMQSLVGPSGVSALPAFPAAHRPTQRSSRISSHARPSTSHPAIGASRLTQRAGHRWSSRYPAPMGFNPSPRHDASPATGQSSSSRRGVATQAYMTNEYMANEYDAVQNAAFWTTRPVPVTARYIKIGGWWHACLAVHRIWSCAAICVVACCTLSARVLHHVGPPCAAPGAPSSPTPWANDA